MDEASRAKRTAALQEKKRRLEDLKKRRAAAASGGSTSSRVTAVAARTSPQKAEKGGGADLDNYIDDLLNKPSPLVVTDTPKAVVEASAPVVNSVAATVSVPAAAVTKAAPAPAAAAAVAAAPVIAASKVETFAFGTQTIEEDFPHVEKSVVEEEKKEEESLKGDEREDEPDSDAVGASNIKIQILSPEEKENTLSSDDFSSFFVNASKKVERLLGAPVLADLLLDADYSDANKNNDDSADSNNIGNQSTDNKSSKKNSFVAGRACFECSRWTQHRDVTDMDWSPIHKELILTSYHMPNFSRTGSSKTSDKKQTNTDSADQPAKISNKLHNNNATLVPKPGENQADGLALVWSLAMPERPEHIFTCNSPILCTKFHPTEHHLIVGGTHSGQLAVWDLRVGRLPVQRSSLSTVANKCKGHSHPVCNLDLADGGSGLVTASTDGKVNFWSLANLRDPAESLMMSNTNISSLAVAPETNTIICGDERGSLSAIYPQNASNATGRANSSRRAMKKIHGGFNSTTTTGNSNNKDTTILDTGHFGMITGVATKPTSSLLRGRGAHSVVRGFLGGSAGLVLTCGVDWTTKLWAPAYKDEPILSFVSPSYDYMADVQWSPTNPSLFATASSKGTLGLWNLANDLDEPMTKNEGIVVDDTTAGGGHDGRSGLNKLRWSADGRRIAVASSDRLFVLSMTEEVSKPKADDETKMMNNLTSRGFLDEE